MSYETLELAIEDRIATVTLNRPKVLNGLNAAMQRQGIPRLPRKTHPHLDRPLTHKAVRLQPIESEPTSED